MGVTVQQADGGLEHLVWVQRECLHARDAKNLPQLTLKWVAAYTLYIFKSWKLSETFKHGWKCHR